MHIYLRKGGQQRWLIVELADGHIPRLAGYSGSHSHVADTLEPAIWFKVMVIDSISIDCDKRVVCWNPSSSDAASETRYLMFDDKDQNCYDFDDDLDELYELANFLVSSNPMTILNERERKDLSREYERSLFRLLHCYILGKITLHPEDIFEVEQAHNMQLQAIRMLEDSILMHRRISEQYMNDMRELQESRILPFFNQLVAHGCCSREINHLLKENVVRYIDRVKNEIDIAQRRVEQIKKDMRQGAISQDYANTLATARGKRDILAAKMHQLLEWRELLDSKSKSIKILDVKGPTEPVISRFMELHDKISAEKSLSNAVCDKKVLAVSVRVCIENALKDLRAGQNTVAEETAADGQRSTNVINNSEQNAEWQTLTERLASILYNKDHPAGQTFLDLTSSVIQRCKGVFDSCERLSDMGSLASDVEGFVIINSRNLDFSHDLNSIKADILNHLDVATALLMECFQKNSQMFSRKLRLSYEKLLFHQVGDYLLRLYYIVNGNVMESLEERVTRLREFPVCRLGLQMKQEWWLSLFDPITTSIDFSQKFDKENDDDCCPRTDRTQMNNFFFAQGMNSDSCQDTENRCYKNIDLMREKLQIGTAKVLSRSLTYDNVSHLGENVVVQGASVMEKEVRSKVDNFNSFVPLHKIVGSLRHRNLTSHTRLCSSNVSRSFGSRRNRTHSTPNLISSSPFNDSPDLGYASPTFVKKDSFKRHFGEVLESIRGVFEVESPLHKMQHLTVSLRQIAEKVSDLRKQGASASQDDNSHAISSDDLLPLLVLMLLKLTPKEAAKLFVEICYISDLMPDFLSSGCHSFALTEYQISFRILSQVCEELEIS